MKSSRFLIRLSLPDLVTLLGGAFALLAIYVTLQGALWLGLALLYVAMLADALDGKVARWLGHERPFGRYLDGFADQLLYLVATGLQFYLGGFQEGWSLFIALMIGCGCMRLSCFNESGNITHEHSLAYRGMPVFWSLFILSGWKLLQLFTPPLLHNLLLAVVLSAFSLAMITDRPFFKFSSLNVIIALCCTGFVVCEVLHLSLEHG